VYIKEDSFYFVHYTVNSEKFLFCVHYTILYAIRT